MSWLCSLSKVSGVTALSVRTLDTTRVVTDTGPTCDFGLWLLSIRWSTVEDSSFELSGVAACSSASPLEEDLGSELCLLLEVFLFRDLLGSGKILRRER